MAGPLLKHAPPPQAKPEKTPHPPWSKPLTWLTALLAAGCLVLLLACLLQGQIREQRFQDYEAAMDGVDHVVAEYLELRTQLQASEADVDFYRDKWNDANNQNLFNTAFLVLETQFQAGNYETCADIIVSIQSEDLLSQGYFSSYSGVIYDHTKRFQEIADFLIDHGYLFFFLDFYAVPIGTAEVPDGETG